MPASTPSKSPLANLTLGLIGCGAMLALGVAGLVLLFASGALSYDAGGTAVREAQEAVVARLGSPGSAEFEIARVAARDESKCYYVVYLVVASQDAFGALLRNYALVLVRLAERIGADGQVLHVEITEQSPQAVQIKELTQGVGEEWELEDWVTAP